MKKSLFGITLIVFSLFIVIATASSCRKPTYRRSVYRANGPLNETANHKTFTMQAFRGPGARYSNTRPVKVNRTKFKSSNKQRYIRVRHTKYGR